jgi:hypothetical protein
VRQEVLAGHTQLPKHKIVKSPTSLRRLKGRLHAEDFSFMWGLKSWHQEDALAVLARLPADEYAVINTLFDQPGFPAKDALDLILRRLPARPPDARQRLYELHASPDPRDRARALPEATGDTPILFPPLRQLKWAGEGLQRALKDLDQCVQLDPKAPWSARLQALIMQVQALQKGELAQVMAEVKAYFEIDPDVDVPANETVDDTKDREGAVDQGMPELEAERDHAAASNFTTSRSNPSSIPSLRPG